VIASASCNDYRPQARAAPRGGSEPGGSRARCQLGELAGAMGLGPVRRIQPLFFTFKVLVVLSKSGYKLLT
jgi:hypothetical protein